MINTSLGEPTQHMTLCETNTKNHTGRKKLDGKCMGKSLKFRGVILPLPKLSTQNQYGGGIKRQEWSSFEHYQLSDLLQTVAMQLPEDEKPLQHLSSPPANTMETI